MMRTGVWLVGARGSVATTAMVGAAALTAGLTNPVGCVSEDEGFGGAGLPDMSELVFGETLVKSVLAPMFVPARAAAKRAAKRRITDARSATRLPATCTSTTSPNSESGRQPGITFRSTASSAPP